MHRLRLRIAAVLAATFVLSAMGVVPVVAASNSPDVYFGSTACPSGVSACPGPSWTFTYPYGTGGGYTTKLRTISGQNSFSPVTAGGSTVTDIIIKNVTGKTISNVAFKGGTAAPTRVPKMSVPTMPKPPSPVDAALCSWTTRYCRPSLPAGLDYQAVEILSNASAAAITCSLTASTGLAAGLFDGISCSIPTLAKNASVTLRVVIATKTVGTYEPWFSVRIKEAADDADYDLFTTYGKLTVAKPTCGSITTYVPGGTKLNLSNTGIDVGCSPVGDGAGGNGPQSTSISTGTGLLHGVFASVGNTDSPLCLTAVTCFGQLSFAHVDGGAPIPGGLTWTITWSHTLFASDEPNDYDDVRPQGVIHFLDGYPANPNAYEQIRFHWWDRCGPTVTKLCWVSLTHDSSWNWTAVLESPYNGSIKGF